MNTSAPAFAAGYINNDGPKLITERFTFEDLSLIHI